MMEKSAILQEAEKQERSPLSFFVRSGHMTILALIGLVVGGGFTFLTLPIESTPEIKIPIATVSTFFPGASPGDVEKLVTDELEKHLKNIDDLEELTSDSTEGNSIIIVEFDARADITESLRTLRDEVDTAKRDLPSELEDDPIVTQIRADDRPIVEFTMLGNAPISEFKEHADDLHDLLEDIDGVSDVTVDGIPEREMQVLVDTQKLEGFELSITDVAQSISRGHIDLPVGAVRTDEYYYQVSLRAQFENPEEIRDTVVAVREGQNIFVRDIATVREAFAETTSETRLFTAESGEYRQAVSVGIFKNVGEDLVKIVNEAKDVVTAFNEELPNGLFVLVSNDEADRIWEDIRRLLTSAWQTVLIIGITLFLALGFREAFAAAFSIPVLYLITVIGLGLVGETFNFLVFFALILTLGIAIDTSIVIIEGVYENMRSYGLDARRAALASVGQFRAPLISGSLTTIAAFLPLGLMTGIMGEYVKHIPITVNITLLASLFTALMILPSVAVWLLSRRGAGEAKPPLLRRPFDALGGWYKRNIHRILHSKRERRLWIASMIVLFFLSGVLSATGIVKFKLFASSDINLFFVSVEAPEGSSLERTKLITENVESIVEETPELIRFVTVYGAGGSHKARITVTLTDPSDRKDKSFEIAQDLREELRSITEAEVLVEELDSGPPGGADIQVRILGDELRKAENVADQIQRILESVPGAIDVTNDLEISPGEYHLTVKRDRLQFFGTNASSIGSVLRTAVFGDTSAKIREGDEEKDIAVKLDYRSLDCVQRPLHQLLEARDAITICRSNPEDIASLLRMQIPTERGLVPLSEMVEVDLVPAVTTIRHFNTDRSVSVKANIEEGFVLAEVLTVLQDRVAELELPSGITVQYGGENEDTNESMESLARASVLAILLIFGILVYQFHSFRQVFIVLTTMPLAIMGVLYGLAVIRVPLSFPGMIGIVALLGVVVNDAIVLIDKINKNRAVGYSLIEAVELGCKQRLEPVIITTLTTALGVVPLMLSGEVFRDLAITIAVGIVVATVFTLVVVPVLYVMWERKTNENVEKSLH